MSIETQNYLGNFETASRNTFNRKFGAAIHPVDPYISGYFYVFFDLPFGVYDMLESFTGPYKNTKYNDDTVEQHTSEGKDFIKMSSIVGLLTATCVGVTSIPSGTNNKVEYVCQGGLKYSENGFNEYTSEINLRFIEITGIPVFKILSAWSRLLKHKSIGNVISTSESGESSSSTGNSDIGKEYFVNKYDKSKYSGNIYYCTVKPDGHTIEYYACYEGIFPLRDPHDQFSTDLTSIDKREIDMTFNVDYMWQEPWVYKECLERVKSVMEVSRKSIYDYTGDITLSKK